MKPTPAQQAAKAESALGSMINRFPHVETKPKALCELLAQRFDNYLEDAVHPRNAITAMELIASAKELLHVAFCLDALGTDEYRTRHTAILAAQRKVMIAQEDRARLARGANSFSDGGRS